MLLVLYRNQKMPKRVKKNPEFLTFAEISYTDYAIDIVIAFEKMGEMIFSK